jgi:hypothetical protein
MITLRFPLFLSRTVLTHAGALALAVFPAACAAGDPTESDESAEVSDAPAITPQMAASCELNPSHSCCLSACGDYLYDCNTGCRDPDVYDRGACFNACQASYNSCLPQCDTIWLHTPPW